MLTAEVHERMFTRITDEELDEAIKFFEDLTPKIRLLGERYALFAWDCAIQLEQLENTRRYRLETSNRNSL